LREREDKKKKKKVRVGWRLFFFSLLWILPVPDAPSLHSNTKIFTFSPVDGVI
jgi:hypothetical protein